MYKYILIWHISILIYIYILSTDCICSINYGNIHWCALYILCSTLPRYTKTISVQGSPTSSTAMNASIWVTFGGAPAKNTGFILRRRVGWWLVIGALGSVDAWAWEFILKPYNWTETLNFKNMFFRIEYLCTFTDSQTLSLFRTALQKEHNQSLESIHCMSFQSGQKKTFPWQAWGHTRYNLSLDFCCGTQWKWLGPPENTRRWFHFTLWLCQNSYWK